MSSRQAARHRARALPAILLALLMAMAACSTATGVDATSAPSSLPSTNTPTTSPTPTTNPTSPVATPMLLVAHEAGIDIHTADGSTALLRGRPIAFAVPDLTGGILFQEPVSEFGQVAPIEWLPAGAKAPQVLVSGSEGFMLTLVQAVELDVGPAVVFRKWVELPNDCHERNLECRWDHHVEYLMTRSLAGGAERNMGGIGSFESDVIGLRFGGDRVAFSLNRYEEGACAGWLPLTTITDGVANGWIGEGSDMEEACAAGPTPSCPAGERCDGEARAAASPDGSLIAYAFSEWRPATGEHLAPTLVIHDPATGATTLRLEVGEAGVQPTWFDFDGRFALLGRIDTRRSGDEQAIEPLLVDTAGAAVTIPIRGRATLWSGPDPRFVPAANGAPHRLPIDQHWTVTSLEWPIQPSCCDSPATGPASPPGSIPHDGIWPADGLYDVTITRQWDPPSVLGMSVRRWVSCSELPERCPTQPPPDGIVADPATQVDTYLELTDDVAVVIRPLQTWRGGRAPQPPLVITGDGTALHELLTGWCSGYLPERNPTNCGIDHALLDWVWYPHQAGASIDQIIAEVGSTDSAPTFPLTSFDDQATDVPCSPERRCPTAYRGPRGTHLIVDYSLLEAGKDWPGHLYGWWTSLEIRNGRPILYIDTGVLAG